MTVFMYAMSFIWP